MSRLSIKTITLALSFALAGCGNDSPSDTQLSSVISSSELARLYAAGSFTDVIAAIEPKERVGQATDRDFLISAKAYLAILDAVGASVQLDKIDATNRTGDDYILTRVKTLILEEKTDRAKKLLQGQVFTGIYRSEANLVRGDLAFFEQRHEEARSYYDKAINADATDSRFLVARAQVNMALGDIKAAESDALKAVLRDEDSTLAHYTLGVIASRTGRLADAKKHLQDAVARFEDNIAARLELVGIDILQGNQPEAQQSLDRIFAIDPENRTAKFFSYMLAAISGSDEQVRAQLSVLLRQDDKNPQLQRLLGHVAYRLGDNTAAREQLEKALTAAPYDRVSRLALGEIYLRLGQPQAAMQTLEPLTIGADSTDLAAFALASQAAAQTNDLDRAISYTSKTLELAQNPDRALDNEIIASNIDGSSLVVFNRELATYHFLNNDTQQSVSILEKLIEADSDDITSALILCNFQMESGNLDAALGIANQLIEKTPEAAAGYNARAAVWHRKGNSAEALTDYGKALDLNKSYISARQNRGALLLELQEYESAVKDLQRVLDEFPGDLQTQLMFARALVGANDAPRALPYFETLTEAAPTSWRIAYHFGQALAATGEYEKALEANDRAIRLSQKAGNAPDDLLIAARERLARRLRDQPVAN